MDVLPIRKDKFILINTNVGYSFLIFSWVEMK